MIPSPWGLSNNLKILITNKKELSRSNSIDRQKFTIADIILVENDIGKFQVLKDRSGRLPAIISGKEYVKLWMKASTL